MTISVPAVVVSIEYFQVHYLCSVGLVLQQKLPGSPEQTSFSTQDVDTSKHTHCAFSYNSGVARCEVTVFKSFIH